jgi:subtilase family serine protease
MKPARLLALTAAAGLAVSFMAAAAGTTASASTGPQPSRVTLPGSLAPKAAREHPDGLVAPKTSVSFDLLLTLKNAAGARAFVKAVSTPGTREFHHFLKDWQWESRFGPSSANVARAISWLRANDFTVGSVAKDRVYVPATGTAYRIERTFGVTLGYYKVNGKRVRLAQGSLTIPSSMAGVVSGAVGVNEYLASTGLAAGSPTTSLVKTKPDQEPGPPAGFRNARPCSAYWGQLVDRTDSAKLYAPYKGPLPYDICGYKPAQLRSAYGLTKYVASGDDGSGIGLAIVDAYDSPTLFSDAHRYFQVNDPAHPLLASQFINLEPPTVDDQALCGGSGWYPEQALDVETSHTMAPGATILFVGAQDCTDASLLAALTTAVTSGASVVSDSWGDTLGDLFTDAATKAAYEDTFLVADATGVSVLFSSGDTGDNFADFGLAVPNYPASDPFITAVGGTALEINAAGQRQAEYGWSTAKQVLCEPATTRNCGTATSPLGALGYDYGGGGGNSYTFSEPYYQVPVVPADLALRNAPIFGVATRVVPDIAMDADPQTGFLIGLTQSFPTGNRWSQFKEGGTSLASPMLAGVVADADQAAVTPLGFLNPVLYKAYQENPAAFYDVVAPKNPLAAAVIRVDFANEINPVAGYIVTLRTLNYEGQETYCDGTGNCATRDVTLSTAPGFDSMTGLGSVGPEFIATLSQF